MSKLLPEFFVSLCDAGICKLYIMKTGNLLTQLITTKPCCLISSHVKLSIVVTKKKFSFHMWNSRHLISINHFAWISVVLVEYWCSLSFGGIGKVWIQKNHTRKISNHKGFELYQVFMHDFLYQNILIFPLYILLTRCIGTIWYKNIDTFWSGGINTVWTQKSHKKNQ